MPFFSERPVDKCVKGYLSFLCNPTDADRKAVKSYFENMKQVLGEETMGDLATDFERKNYGVILDIIGRGASSISAQQAKGKPEDWSPPKLLEFVASVDRECAAVTGRVPVSSNVDFLTSWILNGDPMTTAEAITRRERHSLYQQVADQPRGRLDMVTESSALSKAEEAVIDKSRQHSNPGYIPKNAGLLYPTLPRGQRNQMEREAGARFKRDSGHH